MHRGAKGGGWRYETIEKSNQMERLELGRGDAANERGNEGGHEWRDRKL